MTGIGAWRGDCWVGPLPSQRSASFRRWRSSPWGTVTSAPTARVWISRTSSPLCAPIESRQASGHPSLRGPKPSSRNDSSSGSRSTRGKTRIAIAWSPPTAAKSSHASPPSEEMALQTRTTISGHRKQKRPEPPVVSRCSRVKREGSLGAIREGHPSCPWAFASSVPFVPPLKSCFQARILTGRLPESRLRACARSGTHRTSTSTSTVKHLRISAAVHTPSSSGPLL